MDYTYFIHPKDAAAIDKLKKIPCIDVALKWVMKLGVEQYCHGLYMANHIRLSSRQLPRIFELLPPICEKFGIEVPELFLQMYPTPNAYTIGDQKNYIVITSGLLDCVSDTEELSAVFAHECGHILCRHVYYSTMIQMIMNFGMQKLPLLAEMQNVLAMTFNAWRRESELSADRASAVCLGNVLIPIHAILRLAGGASVHTQDLNIDEYMNQIIESESLQADARWQRFLRDYSEMEDDHPFTVTRVKELLRWGKSQQFVNLVEN